MRCFIALFYAIIFLCGELHAKPLALSVHAEAAILVNAETGAILYEKNAHSKYYPASTTKVATALVALKKTSDFDVVVVAEQDSVASITEEAQRRSNYTVPAYWLIPGGTHVGIKRGEELSLRDLLFAMMIASANDAANVIAQHLGGGTIPPFIKQMNDCLREIGCKNTQFYNPHGLYHPKHQTTAYDLSVIMREALKYPFFCEMIATIRYTRPKTNKQESTPLLQGNKLMRKGKHYYAKAIGGKTGYLSVAGNTLVVAAKDNQRTLIAVLLNTKERDDMFQDAIKMFDTAFNQPKVKSTLLKAGPQKHTLNLPGAPQPIVTYLKNDVSIEYYPAEETKVKCFLSWSASKLPIKKDEQIGELKIQNESGETLQVVPLLAQDDVSSTLWWSICHPFS